MAAEAQQGVCVPSRQCVLMLHLALAAMQKGMRQQPIQQPMAASPPQLCRKQGGSGFGQLALRRPQSAPDQASGCHMAPTSLGQSAAWAALANHTGPVMFDRAQYMSHAPQPGSYCTTVGPVCWQ